MKRATKTIQERFWSKVKKTRSCWNWTGSTSRGYGTLNIKGSPVYAHRLSYQFHFGNYDSDMHVLHKCDNPACINPLHLFLGTHQDNMKDMSRKGRNSKLDKNGIYINLKSCPRGKKHWANYMPDRISRGAKHRKIMKKVAARGERAGQAKLTEREVLEIRHLYSQGIKGSELARTYQTSHTNISKIILRYRWSHI